MQSIKTDYPVYISLPVLIRSLLAGIFILHAFSSGVFGRDVSFNWKANTDNPPAEGYRLYYKLGDPGSALSDYSGTDSSNGNPSPVKIPGQSTTSYVLSNLLDFDKYSFVLTAYRGSSESGPSAPIILGAKSSTTGNLNATLSVNPPSGPAPLLVTFNGSMSTGSISKYDWTFGDGTAGSGSVITHTYNTPGNFTVVLKVTDNQGVTSQTSFVVKATGNATTNHPPKAVIVSSSSAGPRPLSVVFDGSSSTDPDGDTLAYSWLFGDGGSDVGPMVKHVYATAGTFHARLTVTDGGGVSGTTTSPVVVTEPAGPNNIPPTAVISASATKGYDPLVITFAAGESHDPDGQIVSYIWNFGDGTVASGKNVSHTFSQPARYKVTLKVKDDQGATSLPATFTVRVLEKDGDSLIQGMTRNISAIISLLLDRNLNKGSVQQK